MQRSSPSIGTLASALAKAQGELVNPEKSLVATIRGGGPMGTEQTFRYAPLSSGLDIVRKVLGQHEIATVQTTSIDHTAGIINLTTVLARPPRLETLLGSRATCWASQPCWAKPPMKYRTPAFRSDTSS